MLQGVWDGAGNLLYGAYSVLHDLVTMPIDLVMTTWGIFDVYSQWEPLSFFGASTDEAFASGGSIWSLEGTTVLNLGTLGIYGLLRYAYEWYETGDATGFQRYTGGFALVTFTAGYATGVEISVGRNLRLAPFGNRTGHRTGRFPHYHRRVVDRSTGETVPGQGIGRHRPWDIRSTDTSFWDRF